MIYRDDLERVYALIEREENWTQKRNAADASGAWVADDDPAACKWCLVGAVVHAGVDKTAFYEFSDAQMGVRLPMEFNDFHTHAEVLALLKSAIERAPGRPE